MLIQYPCLWLPEGIQRDFCETQRHGATQGCLHQWIYYTMIYLPALVIVIYWSPMEFTFTSAVHPHRRKVVSWSSAGATTRCFRRYANLWDQKFPSNWVFVPNRHRRVCIYIYIHVYIHTLICIYVYIYVICIRKGIYMYIRISIYIYV